MNSAVLAFDFGEKRIGVAVGDTSIGIAHPLMTIENESNEVRFAAIAEAINEWKPGLLVVGLPLYLNGEPHEMTRLARKFANRLEGRFRLPTALVDERLSSMEASQSLREIGIFGRNQKVMLDQVAAQRILQQYFDQHTHATA